MKSVICSLSLLIFFALSCTQSSPQEESRPTWEIVPLMDKFGDPTGETAIIGVFEGTMSNSAVQGAPATAMAQLGDNGLNLTLYNYADKPANLPDRKTHWIDVKKADGSTMTVEGFCLDGVIYDNNAELYQALIAQTQPLKIIIDVSNTDRSRTELYRFDINPEGLSKLLQ